ncbi:MAG: hypothetical protein KC766_16785 [Myxococcales bacterium]|nr:hypothetical protein [Myxococcales bacterium]
MRSLRFLIAASLFVLPLVSGCSSDDCTELGCSGLQFDLTTSSAGSAEPKTVRICEEDRCSEVVLKAVSDGVWRGESERAHVEWRETADGATLSGYTYEPLPDVESALWGFEVSASDGSVLYDQKINVTYEPIELNGPGCGACTGGVIEA